MKVHRTAFLEQDTQIVYQELPLRTTFDNAKLPSDNNEVENLLGLSGKEDQIAKLKQQFQEEFSKLRLEIEKLRLIYPLYDLLALKQFEIERLKKALNLIEQEHPEYRKLELIISDHFEEREVMKSLIANMEIRFNRYLDRTQAAELKMSDLLSNFNCLDDVKKLDKASCSAPEF